MTARSEIAAAASLAGVVNVTPYYRQSLKTGDGFVRFASQARSSNGFGWMKTWEVWVAVPQDVEAAEKWLETNLQPLIDRLDTELIVTGAAPAELVLGTTTANGLIVTGAREA